LATPAFERLDVLMGKYGEDGDKLIFKILRRGEHEGTGEADLALRYDLTVPLARVAAAYGSQLPVPYKRYAMAPVWRADRPGRGPEPPRQAGQAGAGRGHRRARWARAAGGERRRTGGRDDRRRRGRTDQGRAQVQRGRLRRAGRGGRRAVPGRRAAAARAGDV